MVSAGTRPSTAYGLRTKEASAKQERERERAGGGSGSAGGAGSGGEHVVAGSRSMMRYRRTRAATDSQVDSSGHAWRGEGGAGGGSGSGTKNSLLQRKGEATPTPAWDRPTSNTLQASGKQAGGGGGESRRGSVRELKIFVADWKVKNFDFSSSRAEQGDWGWITRLFIHCENSGY